MMLTACWQQSGNSNAGARLIRYQIPAGRRRHRKGRVAGSDRAAMRHRTQTMSEARNLFPLLRQSADPDTVDAIEKLVETAPDRALCRINVVDFAAKTGVDEERAVAAFL